MRVGAARAVAARWVREVAAREPGFRGAVFSGSTNGMPAGAVLPVWSDVDVLVVREGAGGKLGKFRYRGVLLEVTYLAWAELGSVEEVLGSFVLAGCFRGDTVIADPTGWLTVVRDGVSAGFDDPVWVRRRCAGVRGRIEAGLAAWEGAGPWHAQVTGWLFPTSLTAVLPLVAGLRNPTVRLRYVVAREVLVEAGLGGWYPRLLGLLDAGGVGPGRVAEHLVGLVRTLEVVAEVARTPSPFGADLVSSAWPVVVDGSRELIGAGLHREAMFWIVATYARCQGVLAVDAPERGAELAPWFDAAVADLGVSSVADLRDRAARVSGFLPGWWSVVERALVGAR